MYQAHQTFKLEIQLLSIDDFSFDYSERYLNATFCSTIKRLAWKRMSSLETFLFWWMVNSLILLFFWVFGFICSIYSITQRYARIIIHFPVPFECKCKKLYNCLSTTNQSTSILSLCNTFEIVTRIKSLR